MVVLFVAEFLEHLPFLENVSLIGSGRQHAGPLTTPAMLVLFLPSLSIWIRRLHDTDRSGWWAWLWLVTIIGWIVSLVFAVSCRISPATPHQQMPPHANPMPPRATRCKRAPKYRQDWGSRGRRFKSCQPDIVSTGLRPAGVDASPSVWWGTWMPSLMRPVLALAACVALTVPLVVQPAHAAQYSRLSERTLAQSSLGAGDVPRWISRGTTPELKQSFRKGSTAESPGLCLDRNGESLEGRQARQSMVSTVALRRNTEVMSFIYQYRTREAAVRAWNNLNALAQLCEGRIEVDLSGEGISTRMVFNTTVSQTRPLYGTAGLTLFLDFDIVTSAFDTEFAFVGDSYVSYYLAGKSIVGVAFTSSEGTRGVGRVTRGFVDTMSIVIAQRVERRSLR